MQEYEYGFKIRGRNIYNLFYVDDATLISKALVMKVKRNGETMGLKLNIKRTTPMTSKLRTDNVVGW